jgi:hypothetical protein
MYWQAVKVSREAQVIISNVSLACRASGEGLILKFAPVSAAGSNLFVASQIPLDA